MGQIQVLVDEMAGEVRGSYQQMLLGMQGAWVSFTADMTHPVTSRVKMSAQLTQLLDAFGPLLRTRALAAVAAAHVQGVADAQGVEDLTEAPLGFMEEAQATLQTAAARDARGLSILSSQTLIRFDLARRRMPAAMARMAALGELPSQAHDIFVQLDRLQRKRNSADFVAAALRLTMFSTYFHAFTESLVVSDRNTDTFVAVHPEHEPVDLQLLAGWGEWAAQNTHPNTRWSLQLKEPA